MKKILLYGGCIYGDGGASKNIKRLTSYIEEHGLPYDCDAYHYNRCKIEHCHRRVTGFNIFGLLRKNRYDLIMVYSVVNWRFQLAVALASILFRFKIVLSIRNDRFKENYLGLRLFERLIFRFFNARVSSIVGVNKDTDYFFLDRSKISIIPGYIDPAKEEYDCRLPEEIESFFREHETVIASNASKLWKYHGVDLYGVDLAIDLLRELKHRGYQGVGILFVIPVVDAIHMTYLKELETLLDREGLTDDFLIWRHSLSFPAVLKKCDISLRLTSSDGDSISLRESLFFGKPVIASDSAPRPEGTIVFRSRDLSDLTEKTISTLLSLNSDSVHKVPANEDNAARLIHLWMTVLS